MPTIKYFRPFISCARQESCFEERSHINPLRPIEMHLGGWLPKCPALQTWDIESSRERDDEVLQKCGKELRLESAHGEPASVFAAVHAVIRCATIECVGSGRVGKEGAADCLVNEGERRHISRSWNLRTEWKGKIHKSPVIVRCEVDPVFTMSVSTTCPRPLLCRSKSASRTPDTAIKPPPAKSARRLIGKEGRPSALAWGIIYV